MTVLKRGLKLAVLFGAGLSLYGCAVNLHTCNYALSGVGTRPHGSASCYTLLVAEPTAQPGYDTDQLIYMNCPYELRAFSQNRWVAPPHEMLTSLISQNLRNTGFFRAVVTAPYAGETQYKIETRLIKLQHEFFCSPSRVRLGLHAVLIDACSHQAIAERVFEVVIPAPLNNPYGGVIAANQAVRIALGQMTDFVICTIQRGPCLPLPRSGGKPT